MYIIVHMVEYVVEFSWQSEAWAENREADFRFMYIFKISLVQGDGEISEGKAREMKKNEQGNVGTSKFRKTRSQTRTSQNCWRTSSGLSLQLRVEAVSEWVINSLKCHREDREDEDGA